MFRNQSVIPKCNSVTSVTRKEQDPPQKISYYRLQQSFQEWLELFNYSKSSISRMPRQIQEFFSWLIEKEIPFKSITRQDTKDFYHYIKYHRKSQNSGNFLKNTTLNSYILSLKLFAHYLEETDQGKLTVDLLYEPINTPEKVILTQAEINQLYQVTTDDAIGLRERAILSLYYGCGIRSNEGIQMNLEDVILKQKMVYVRKGKKYRERYVPFLIQQQKDFTNYLKYSRPNLVGEETENAFLIGNTGKRINYGLLLNTIKKLQQRTQNLTILKKQIGLHTLRHSIATHLMQSGMKIDNISQFLGHSNIRSTQIYTHLAHENEE
jgi:site-specific recombinase XerD